MSLPKAQLVDPQGNINLPGLSATGVITATSFSGVADGTVTGLSGTPDLNLGIVTATSFVGQGVGHAAGLTGTPELNLGVTTATSFVGDAVGKAAGLTGTPNLNVGLITATSFVGFVTGNITGNVTGLAMSVTPGVNLGVGVCTAIQYHGDGSTLTGAGSSAYIAQEVTATSGTTTINLTYGNLIYLAHDANTTIAFSNPSAAEQITIIRSATDHTLTWPASVLWKDNTIPTLFEKLDGYQIFRLTTVDTGTTYQAWEESASSTTYNLWVMGYGGGGGLGLNDKASRSSPTQLTGTWNIWHGATWPSAGMSQLYGDAGTLWGFGGNSRGSMGQNNSQGSYSSPIQIGTDSDWSYWVIGEGNCLATKTNGSLWSWGTGRYGNLGTNTPFNDHRSSPVQIPGTWSQGRGKLASGYHRCFAIKTNGTLWVWGRNFTGTLGLNESSAGYANSRSSPTQIPGTNWGNVWTGGNNQQAIMDNSGNLYTMGWNGYGFCGQNDTVDRSSPTQVPGTWTRFIGASNALVATKSDNTLWAWGSNSYGQLGQNANIPTIYSSPIQITGSWNKDSLEFASQMGFVAKKVGSETLWGWGGNFQGELGQNNTTRYSSPTQLTTRTLQDYGAIGGNQFAWKY